LIATADAMLRDMSCGSNEISEIIDDKFSKFNKGIMINSRLNNVRDKVEYYSNNYGGFFSKNSLIQLQ
jgi:hypothetical protein